MSAASIPDWVAFPAQEWERITPQQAGLDAAAFETWVGGLGVRGASFGGEDHTGSKFGTVLTRGGYLVHSWGDPDYRFQTASVGKALMFALVGIAVGDGLFAFDEPINRRWTGAGQLSHEHKHLDVGHHRTLTWHHLIGDRLAGAHYGGFPMELGVHWRNRETWLGSAAGVETVPGVPAWANWTGDPFFDCYAHTRPGTVALYSSAGTWRLAQALTAVFGRDLKDVVDERIFGPIGIPADRWEWPGGGWIKDQVDWYPTIPHSYTYLDPPYEIDGHLVRSGPGWVVISAADWARFGHLNATSGWWNGRLVLDPAWLRGHGGGNRSGVSGDRRQFTALGVVTSDGIDHPHGQWPESFIPGDLFTGPVTVRR